MHGIAEEGVMFLGIGPLNLDKISLGIVRQGNAVRFMAR